MEELFGCWQEARRCDRVAAELVRIRNTTELEFWDPVTVLLREVESTSRLLRDLHDLFPIYRPRVPIVIHYLTIILPCLQKTLRDMMIYIDNAIPAPTQWEYLNERLSNQGGIGLAPRFVMYYTSGLVLSRCELLIPLKVYRIPGSTCSVVIPVRWRKWLSR